MNSEMDSDEHMYMEVLSFNFQSTVLHSYLCTAVNVEVTDLPVQYKKIVFCS